jgi:hypothetical protein
MNSRSPVFPNGPVSSTTVWRSKFRVRKRNWSRSVRRKYNCYIIFGTYAKDEKNWPGHILHLMVMAKPDGSIVTHWKQRNVRGMFPGGEQYTSVIYDVYDRFVEMYGIDAVIPVERTDIGNIAMSAVQFEPELFRCMAFKGAETDLSRRNRGVRVRRHAPDFVPQQPLHADRQQLREYRRAQPRLL